MDATQGTTLRISHFAMENPWKSIRVRGPAMASLEDSVSHGCQVKGNISSIIDQWLVFLITVELPEGNEPCKPPFALYPVSCHGSFVHFIQMFKPPFVDLISIQTSIQSSCTSHHRRCPQGNGQTPKLNDLRVVLRGLK